MVPALLGYRVIVDLKIMTLPRKYYHSLLVELSNGMMIFWCIKHFWSVGTPALIDGVVDSLDNFHSSSLFTLRNIVTVCQSIWVYVRSKIYSVLGPCPVKWTAWLTRETCLSPHVLARPIWSLFINRCEHTYGDQWYFSSKIILVLVFI